MVFIEHWRSLSMPQVVSALRHSKNVGILCCCTMMMLFKTTLGCLLLAAAAVEATTTVAVLEFGKGGVVRRTSSQKSKTSVRGVSSFWNALHSHSSSRRRQHAGMTVVPDLFHKASSGLIVGLHGSGVDLAEMPVVSSLVEQEGSNGVVGHFHVDGATAPTLMKESGIANINEVNASTLHQVRASSGLHAVECKVHHHDTAQAANSAVAALLESLAQQAEEADTTIVLHLVVEEEEGAARRRQLSTTSTRRRLEDGQQQGEEENNQEEGQEEEGEGEDNNGNQNNNNNNQNGYYGYGYYNDAGEWVTPYKTMFQIQYFNVVLWTAIALVIAVVYSVKLMIGMPLMADTLLFGESAKMMGE